ncbi:MAG TPA: bifunctional serine/threonine-protein kinase/formylglycine-generating enzyme family protein [Polyangia bacterium]|jgi:formylglycine-generating enzyme required for sulfatase activity|nr:bifunctional serine/threonine-protein kinase/formylglycine-generating enzyme family protein [Polyangia bacterium]
MTKVERSDQPESSVAPSRENDGSPARLPASQDAGPRSASPPTVDNRVTGAHIGRYVILERVGSGAMGVVYGAYDPELDRKIALKLLLKPRGGAHKPGASARLLREAKAMARLAHPNVVAVHDVGLVDEQVFLAMEFLAGGTLRRWLQTEQRSWRQILDVFIAAGRGLAAAHAAGLVHRDFKPENVLLDKDGRPRVVDFGLARESGSTTEDESASLGGGAAANEITVDAAAVAAASAAAMGSRTGGGHLETLTRTGALMGTPAYMAPEQFLGERADERTDQFSFCVALYEALYGERPFAGDDLISLSVSVTEGQVRALPKDRGVPTWVRRAILRGLRPNPVDRFPSMAWLIGALEDDPAIKRRRRLIAAGLAGVVLASLFVAEQMVARKRRELDRQIARNLDDATTSGQAASATAAKIRDRRGQAFAAFDAMDGARGEALWAEAVAAFPALSAAAEHGEQSLEAALVLDSSRTDVRAQLADALFAHLLWLDEFRQPGREGLASRLGTHDVDGHRRAALNAPGSLQLNLQPASAHVTLEQYQPDAATSLLRAVRVTALNATEATRALPAGSYRLVVDGPGLATVDYPFEVGRSQAVTVAFTVPAAAAVPADFAYVPAGSFWFGDADERLRKEFLGTVPIHPRKTPAYLIARHETTYADWIAFLSALPPAERAPHLPDVYTSLRGSVRLRPLAGDRQWQLTLQPTTSKYTAVSGAPIEYSGRDRRARQDWSRFPVSGISPEDASAYTAWLRQTGRVRGARLCTELEWERAARGADDRLFPHGDEVHPDDANIDVTYGRVSSAYGPDEVGAHPSSRSPFDLDDMTGNVFELLVSSESANETVIRGGAYYFAAVNGRITNRERVPSSFRDMATGFRLCADAEGGP